MRVPTCLIISLLATLILLSGCGDPMIAIVKPYREPSEKIIIGLTTRNDVHALLGEPWATNVETNAEIYIKEGGGIGFILIVPFPSNYLHYAIVNYDSTDQVASIRIDKVWPNFKDKLWWEIQPPATIDREKRQREIDVYKAMQASIVIEGDAEMQLQMYWDEALPSRHISLCRSADQKHPEARYRFGILFEHGGEGLPQDFAKAYYWYTLGANAGSYWSKQSANRISEKLTPDQLTEAKYLIENWQPGQCEQDLISVTGTGSGS